MVPCQKTAWGFIMVSDERSSMQAVTMSFVEGVVRKYDKF